MIESFRNVPTASAKFPERGVMWHALVAALSVTIVLLPVRGAWAANACESPGEWPLGDHRGEVARDSGIVATQGWDPAFHTKKPHQAMKDALTNGIATYHVGLPGSTEPYDLRKWTGSCEWSNDSLRAAGMPQISLPSETGGTINGVYLVAGYNMQHCTVWLQPGVKVAAWSSAFNDVRTADGTGGVWIVDSLVDASTGQKGPFRGGEKNSTCNTHVMYSEQMGGLDVGKAHNMTYYRNHLHASMKVDAGHADGLQINSTSKCAFIFENNIDFLFRMTNRPLFLQNSNAGGIHHTWVVNNLIGGGGSCMDTCAKDASNAPRFGPCTDSVVCGNRCLGDNGNVSWANPTPDTSGRPVSLNSGDGASGYHYRENNGFYSASGGHRTSVTDNEGDVHTFQSSPAAPSSLKSEIDQRVLLLESWVAEIRAAAGADGTSTPRQPPTAPEIMPKR